VDVEAKQLAVVTQLGRALTDDVGRDVRLDFRRLHHFGPGLRIAAALTQSDSRSYGTRRKLRTRFGKQTDGNAFSAMDERSARLAQNEAIFRAGNEAIDARRDDGARERREYVCECGIESCFERVVLTPEEYETVRAHPARFFVAPGHEDLSAGEVVVEHFSRFAVVEKRGEEREIVERSDPRAVERG
jgi:hypothetical protein